MRVLFLGLLLAGCASDPIVITESKYISPVPVHPPLPTSVDLSPPKFYVITELNCESVFLKTSEDAFFAVSATGYQELAENVQKLRRYILELQNLLVFYREAIDYQKDAESQNDEQTD